MLQSFRFEVQALTDVGPQRHHNEDNYGVFPDLGLHLVADGMGGQSTGGRPSSLAVEEMQAFYADSPTKPWPFEARPERSHEENRLAVAIQIANRQIYETCQRDPNWAGSGTTVAAVSLTGDRIQIAHVGDSRVYRLRGGAVEQLTRDHSLINDWRTTQPNMTEEELAQIPANILTRALGMQEDVLVDTRSETMADGDVYFLATDGACNPLEDPTIADILLGNPALDVALTKLIEEANRRDGSDNATAILVRVSAR